MRIFITADFNHESGLEHILHALSDSGCDNYFLQREYGVSLSGLSIVLVCRNPDLMLKRRIRFAKKERVLYTDIMLDLHEMTAADEHQRRGIVASHLAQEIPSVLAKYAFADFDEVRFKSDWRLWISSLGWSLLPIVS